MEGSRVVEGGSQPRQAVSAGLALRWGGWGVVLAAVLLRCLVGAEPFPFWDIDPGRTVLPTTGITPMQSMSLDVVTLLACGAVLAGEVLSGAPMLLIPWGLWIIGSLGALAQGLWLRSGTIEDVRIGSAWISAMATGLAAMHICRDGRVKRVTLSATVGIVAMLAAKGAIQVFYEHAMTVARYRADQTGFLESQGMATNSVSAKNFERRLFQAEATGWFGLANVFATFVAVGLVSLLGCSILAWRESRVTRRLPDGWAGVLTLGALACGVALVLAGSKGGFTAAGFGVAALAILMLLQRRKRKWILTPRGYGVSAVGLVFAALAAVVLRGLVGERVGELSLLFRWYYMEGAVRAFREHPIWGTGPDGFKDAYMRLKPALSPEEVSSPHSVLFDFAGTLGVYGLVWGALWLGWVSRIGSSIGREINAGGGEQQAAKSAARPELWIMGLTISAAVLASTWVERVMGSPEQAAVRLAGFAGWIGVSVAMLSLLRANAGAAAVVAIGMLAASLHCQIEVTPIWTGSVGWICLMLGAAGAERSGARSLVRSRSFGVIAPAGVLAAAALLAWLGVAPTAQWTNGRTIRAIGPQTSRGTGGRLGWEEVRPRSRTGRGDARPAV